MGKKKKIKKNKDHVKNIENEMVNKIGAMTNKMTEQDKELVKEASEVIDQTIKEHNHNIDRYCQSVEVSSKKLAQEANGGIVWLDDEKKAFAYIQQIAVLSGQLIKTQPERYAITQHLRSMIQIFTTNANLRVDHEFFKKLGY